MRFLFSQKGFTLIELVTTLILVGIIGAFSSFFLYTGIRGFLTSKFSSETALQAQTALDRISAELRYIKDFELIPVQTPNPNTNSIEYRCRDLPGPRRISYNPTSREMLLTVNGTANVLLNNVSQFNLSWVSKNLDLNNSTNEVSKIRVAFTVRSDSSGNETSFSAEIYPRSMLSSP
jgi:prepilin-type N-terminal cleavage/methylation domain-containing protein